MTALGGSACIHIVDDEDDVRQTIAAMLASMGFKSIGYARADDLLGRLDALERGCIVTDVNMPGLSGLDLVRRLKAEEVEHPVVVFSGRADIPMAVDAMKAGAVEFLEKPIQSAVLQEAVAAALRLPNASGTPQADRYVRLVQSLTRRQREVLTGILDGLPNKLIAHRLGLSVRTVEGYRAAIMTRTQVRSLGELVRLAVMGGL
jgi:two-component system, LuxR family, response regulator FixJ